MKDQVLNFWFKEIEPKLWWVKDNDFDQLIRDRFSRLHKAASACELYQWRQSPEGRLAEIIVLDQFSRNMFRDQPQSFASDALALVLAQEAVASGDDLRLTEAQRQFLYLPFMHSESLVIHDRALALYKANGAKENIEFEERHRAIIEKFARYPHRNKILGRVSTEQEIEFLKQPGSSF